MDLSKQDVFAQCFEILQNAPDRICLSPVLNAQILAVDWSTYSVTVINSLERSWDSLIMNNLAMHEAKARFFYTFVSYYKKYLPGDTVCRPPRIEEYYHPAYKSLAFAMWCLQASKGDIDYVLDFEADTKPYSFHHAKRPHHTALNESMAPKGYTIVAHEPTINLASILNPKAFATENNLTPAQAARFTNPIIAECRCKFIHRSKSWCKYKSTYIMYHPPTHLLVACRRPKIEVVKKKICKLNPVFHLGTKLEENASRLKNHEFNGSRIITSKIFPAWKSGSGAFSDKGESRELDIMAAYEIVPLADRNKHESANLV